MKFELNKAGNCFCIDVITKTSRNFVTFADENTAKEWLFTLQMMQEAKLKKSKYTAWCIDRLEEKEGYQVGNSDLFVEKVAAGSRPLWKVVSKTLGVTIDVHLHNTRKAAIFQGLHTILAGHKRNNYKCTAEGFLLTNPHEFCVERYWLCYDKFISEFESILNCMNINLNEKSKILKQFNTDVLNLRDKLSTLSIQEIQQACVDLHLLQQSVIAEIEKRG